MASFVKMRHDRYSLHTRSTSGATIFNLFITTTLNRPGFGMLTMEKANISFWLCFVYITNFVNFNYLNVVPEAKNSPEFNRAQN